MFFANRFVKTKNFDYIYKCRKDTYNDILYT